jgi:SHO1 osmosensor
MPYYGSLDSPSLQKMEQSRAGYGRKRMSLGNVIGDPFALATISIAALSWLISLVGAVIAQINSPNDPLKAFPKFVWWSVVFMALLIPAVFVVVASDSIQTYHVALVGYMGAGLVLTSSSVNSLIYFSDGARQAAAAGFILLSMVNILWIFYFGSAPSGVARAYIDSFALQKESSMGRQTMNAYGGRPETSTSVQPPQMYTSAQLNGFENPSPVGGLNGNGPRNSSPGFAASSTKPIQQQQAEPEIAAPSEYPYRAKAIYSYEANPEDANEISFSKHEILEVSDVSGRWWQARKENGDTGIAPSNYLILL